ncbi:lipase/esterase [Penicillium digitatum]|uniref:Lipase/esterase n=1 Tax=Penicillium digitatum TaxID=36651 RepID=A0A7T6XNF7_PENDI|nr:lipase/esterase [Penicillium digitatum]
MGEDVNWMNLFFSGSRPDILKASELEGQKFRSFRAEDNSWELGTKADKSRVSNANTIQVFWLRIRGHRKYIAKVFPCYSEQDAKIQLHRIGAPLTPDLINDAMNEFDRFYREARAYSHIDLYCSARERIYFPQFHGVITDIPKSRFTSGYYHERAIVVEAIKPDLRSRRVLSELVNNQSESFLTILRTLSERFFTTPGVITLSPFEQQWYHSLLKDRLRRLDALHRIGLTHGDIHDFHFRLPNDIYDTVLYDFSESYTFSMKQPFRVCGGRLRPLSMISEGERERVFLHILNRASSRDLRSHLIHFNRQASIIDFGSEHTSSVDNALWQSLDEETQMLELIMLKVPYRPDGFSMPTLNSIFPFLEAICPNSDLCWHIRRGGSLCQYESVWAVFGEDKTQPQSITFSSMRQKRHFDGRIYDLVAH